jgi:glycosyltransferase involved in cell wall biosynthesis
MKILFVNHTFPPESYAGSELCVLQLARELQNRGHETAVFYRYSDPQADEFHLQESRFEDIQTFKINNTYRAVQRFQEIYLNPVIAAKFSLLLRQWKPEVVHFHHLTNLSLSLVREAKSFGSAVVMTLHDYWLLCQRGQLLKRDLELCHGPGDSACRSCLAPQLLKGRMQGVVSRIQNLKHSHYPKKTGIDLLDLRRAQVNTSNPDFVGITSFAPDDPPNSVLLMHPPAEIHYPIQLKQNGILKTAIAMHPSTTDKPGSGVRFEVRWNEQCLFERELNAKKVASERDWHEVEIPLPTGENPENHLILKTSAQSGEDNQFCTAGWREPFIVLPQTERQEANEEQKPSVLQQMLHTGAEQAAEIFTALSPQAREGIQHRKNWVQHVFHEVDVFISPSRFLRNFFIAHGLPEERIIFSDNGFYPPESVNDRKAVKPIQFGYIGTWIPSKGIRLLLEAFRDVHPQDAQLQVHGFFPGYDGYPDYEQTLRRLAGPAVHFYGKYEPAQVHELLVNMDCLIMPSIWWENSPMTMHEAFLCRVPILTADAGGMAEQVANGGGLTFKHRSVTSLRQRIQEIIDSPAILEELKNHIPPVKSVEEHADEMLTIYQRVLQSIPV